MYCLCADYKTGSLFNKYSTCTFFNNIREIILNARDKKIARIGNIFFSYHYYVYIHRQEAENEQDKAIKCKVSLKEKRNR